VKIIQSSERERGYQLAISPMNFINSFSTRSLLSCASASNQTGLGVMILNQTRRFPRWALYLGLFALPGAFFVIPLAWWLERRRSRALAKISGIDDAWRHECDK
jgi:hypothetical protein